jgi:hypothetical protein
MTEVKKHRATLTDEMLVRPEMPTEAKTILC